jgi:hypothetical protein
VAKKRRKEEKKEVFKKPEFDEIEFMEKEISNTKVAMLTILFSFPIAVVSFFITLGGLPAAGFLVGVGSIFLLKYVYQFFNVDVERFETKDKLGNAAMFFFTWLAVWVLILNMPFSDLTSPTISKVKLQGCPTETIISLKSNTQHTCEITVSSHSFTIEAKVTDNSEVRSVTLVMSSPNSTAVPMTKDRSDYYVHSILLSEGQNLIFYIEAEDRNGHTTTSPTYTFSVT